MNVRRFALTASTIFLFALLWNGLVHLLILREANGALEAIARPAAERSLVLSLLQTAALAVVFLLSYLWANRPGGIKGGLAHGAIFGVAAGLLVDLNQYILYPIPASLTAAWFAFGMVEFCLYGVIASLLFGARK